MQDIPLPEMDPQILQAVAEHIVLPPVIPQQAPEKDEQQQAIECAICQLAVTSSETFAAEEPAANGLWGRIIGAIRKLGDMVGSPILIKDYVLQQLQSMSTLGLCLIMQINQRLLRFGHNRYRSFSYSSPKRGGHRPTVFRTLNFRMFRGTNTRSQRDGMLREAVADLPGIGCSCAKYNYGRTWISRPDCHPVCDHGQHALR